MGYLPEAKSNIGKIYALIPSQPISLDDFRILLKKHHPEVPFNSFHVHIRYLAKKGLITITKNNGIHYYSKIEEKIEEKTEVKLTKGDRLLDYLKANIDKEFAAKDLTDKFSTAKNDFSIYACLRTLNKQGGVKQLATLPKTYLVLPQITSIDKISKAALPAKQEKPKGPIPHVNIANMTIAEIMTDYVQTKQENQQLKTSLQRLANELFQIIEIDKD